MTIIVFLIDTSASMLQRTYVGGRTTLLDVAKSAVETFVKIRQRSPDSRIDRYMLLTFDDPPSNIKAGWKENLATFMNELKNLQCYSMTTMGLAVKQAFDILNINRMTSGIDTYGQGRCPFFLETSVIVLITDGGKLSNVNGVHEEFNLPMNNTLPGYELTREPFRWDQRLFSLVLRLSGTPAVERDTGLVPSDSSPIDAMCEVTGGRSYCITSHRMLNQCIDSLVQKVQNGVVINFEKIGPDPPLTIEKCEDNIKEEFPTTIKEEFAQELPNVNERAIPNTSWYTCRKMIYVPRSTQKGYPVGFWPMPESFWPESTGSMLPPRTAHPNVKFTCTSSDPMVIENLPFDKYELEPSPLTQFILARKQPTICWQVFVANSYKNSDVGHPFGYLKASTNLSCVNLFVMPYNYPVLLPLLDELFKIHRCKPTTEWRNQFQNYLRTMPAYYASPLRRALTRMGAPGALAQSLVPENAENCLSYSVLNYLKKMKNQAKNEYDRLCNEIIQRQSAMPSKTIFNTPEQFRILPKVSMKKDLISHPLLVDKFSNLKEQLMEQGNLFVGTLDKERQSVSFRNAFDIPRNRLMQQVARMRNNFLQSEYVSLDQDSAHSLPISQMGNYQEYLKKQPPQLREIESAPVRQHMFGNPFKIDKRMMVDEADIDLGGSPVTNKANKRVNNDVLVINRPSKRKPGPLPRDLVVRRPSATDTITPPQSPVVPFAPSPVPWLNSIDTKETPNVEETPVPVATVNGIDTSVTLERPRSPSPTLDVPFYNSNEPFTPVRSINQHTYSSVENNHQNDTYSMNYDSDISQILKEANNINNSVIIQEVKPQNISFDTKQEIDEQNLQIRKTLNMLVRRPGRNFKELFENIKTLKGDTNVQVSILRLVIQESLRFKRKHLASLIEEHIQSMLSNNG